MYPPIPLQHKPAAHLATAHVHTKTCHYNIDRSCTAPKVHGLAIHALNLEHDHGVHLGDWACAWKRMKVCWAMSLVRTLFQRCLGWYGLVTLGTFQPIQACQLSVLDPQECGDMHRGPQLTGVNDLFECKGPARFSVPKLDSVEVAVLPWA